MSNSVMDRIRKTLEELCEGDVKMERVFYGRARRDADEPLKLWNYFVFNRKHSTKNNTAKVDMQDFFEVHVIHENYIPEGYLRTVIAALEAQDASGTKLKVTSDDIQYDYVFKGNTDVVVEIATMTVLHPQKRC